MALGPAARAVGLHRPGGQGRPGSATSTTTCTSTSWPIAAWAPCSGRSRPRAGGTTPSSSSPPTTATCAAPTGCGPRGPFVYDEIMRVPLYVKAPGVTAPGSVSSSLGSHVDLAATICALAGVDPAGGVGHRAGDRPHPGVGRSLGVGTRPHPVRPGLGPDHRAQQGALRPARLLRRPHQVRPLLRRRGGQAVHRAVGQVDPGTKLFDVDCAFDDNDHEWYDHDSDPYELVNLANDRSRRSALRDTYERMRDYERQSFVTFALVLTQPSGQVGTRPRHPASTRSRQCSKSASSP